MCMLNILSSAKNSPYRQYKNIVKAQATAMSERLGGKIDMTPTSRKIVERTGIEKETLATLQTMEYVIEYFRALKSKGYTLPRQIYFSEELIPRRANVAGAAVGKNIAFNPQCIDTIDPRVLVHEEGHKLANNAWIDTTLFLRMMDRVIPHLNKKERAILEADYKRAYEEGFFKYNPLPAMVKEGMISNRTAKEFRQTPEKFYLPNSLLDRDEFVADYFNLAVRGFQFSPEIAAKYKKYGGPEIKGILTQEECAELEKMRRTIQKKTLGDYGVSIEA